jgi:hypothetical protein
MVYGVTLLGLVVPGESVPVQGPVGPVRVSGEPAAPLALFRVDGWELSDNDSPAAIQADAQGFRVLELMEAVGNAASDDRLDAEDVARLAVSLKLPGGRVVEVLVPVTEQIIQALEDDGRIDLAEAAAISGSILSGVLTLRS